MATAKSTTETESATSATTSLIASSVVAPENLFAPSVEGDLTSEATLTAQVGLWVSTETITYNYQWQKCNEEGEECEEIAGATSSIYKLSGADIGSSIRLAVTGANTLGSAEATSYQSEVVGASGPPAIGAEGPDIRGATQVGQTVVAEVGRWSGSRPLTYTYQWERCNPSGESCTAIDGADSDSYTIVSEDMEHTLRIAVTATNALASAVERSTVVAVSAEGEASTTPALERVEEADPSALAPAETTTLEGQTIEPQIANSGEVIAANTALTSSTISKEVPGEFAVNTSDGELSVQPLESSPSATRTPLIVNRATALYGETEKGTDTVVRPTPLGATTLLQLHSAQAPTSYSWEVGLGGDQELQELPDGNVAVVEPLFGPDLESELSTGGIEEPEAEEAETPIHEGQSEEEAADELESSLGEEGSLEELPAAEETTTPEISPEAGELQPQDSKAQYERGTSSMASAETEVYGTTVMVIQAPRVLDAKGSTVPAALSVEGNTVTMAITPSGSTKWPVTAELALAAPTDSASHAKASTRGGHFGLSDESASAFDTSEAEDAVEDQFDKRLKDGPLNVERARLVLNWNTSPNNPQLTEWLEAVKKAGLTPFITLRNCEPTPPSYSVCPGMPSLTEYRTSVKHLMKTLIHGTSSRPAVRLWGAWNEPDSTKSPIKSDPEGARIAAYLWGEAKRASEEAGCHHHCTIVAGEFATYENSHLYVTHYEEDILRAERKHRFPVNVRPHVWGMHDYADLENVKTENVHGKEAIASSYYNENAQGFAHRVKEKYRSAHIWMTEQGATLEEEGGLVRLGKQHNLQRFAAKDFLRFGYASEDVEWAYYYEYRGPTSPKKFDSALLSGVGKEPEDWRPAYCVLALGLEGCPPKVTTEAAVSSTITPYAGTVSLNVDPQQSATNYFVEYGRTGGYGKTTTVTAVTNENGEQSETARLSGLEPCTTYYYQAEAENESSGGTPILGGGQTFKTICLPLKGETIEEDRYYHHPALGEYEWSQDTAVILGTEESATAEQELKEAEAGERPGINQRWRWKTSPKIPSWVTSITVTGYEGPEGSSVKSVEHETRSGESIWWVKLDPGPHFSGRAGTIYVVPYRIEWSAT